MSLRIVALLLMAGAVSLGIDFLVGVKRPGVPFVIGFGGCVVIILASKFLGQIWLSRPEAYYDELDRHA